MGAKLKFFKKHWLVFAVILCFLIKLWVVQIQPLYIRATDHDDGMFAKQAEAVLHGRWLGEYNDITLSKGVFGVLFIAATNYVSLDFLTCQHIFYFLACVSILHMLAHVVKSRAALFGCYLVLLFDPITYSETFSTVYRDGVYISLVLFFIAFSFEIFFNRKSLGRVCAYSALFGLTLTCICFCREETVWLAPYLVVAAAVTFLFILKDKACLHKPQKLLAIAGIPIGCIAAAALVVGAINFSHYGRFVTNDYTSRDFKAAYGAITRIRQQNYVERVPLNEETRHALYALSPKFKELEPYLEGKWTEKYKTNEDHDIQDGFLFWALRIAAREAGHYENAAAARDYYLALAAEVNALCDSGQLDALPKRSTLTAPFYSALWDDIMEYIPLAFRAEAAYDYIDVRIPVKVEDPLAYSRFQRITGNSLVYGEGATETVNMKLMEGMLGLYRALNPALLILSLVCYGFLAAVFFKKKLYAQWHGRLLLLSGLFALYVVRAVMVGYIAATAYTAAVFANRYISCIYPVQGLFSMLAILFAAQYLLERRKSA